MAMTILMIDFTLIPVSAIALIALLTYYYIRWTNWRGAAGSKQSDKGRS